MDKALISVIIPVYNVAEYIDRCVESLLSQTYSNIEIILINDGSKDTSSEVCHRLSDLHEDKIKVIDQENKGVSAARNAGLDIASGEYIAFVDADDWVSEDYLEKLYTAIIDNDADLSICAHVMDYDSGKSVYMRRISGGAYTVAEYIGVQGIGMPNIWVSMYKANVIQNNNIRFDSYLRKGEDILFICSYMSKCSKIFAIDDAMYHYYQRSNSACGEYRKYVALGAIKTAYLYHNQYECWNDSDIPEKIYKKHFQKLWLQFIPRQAKYICDFRNGFSRNERKQLLKQVVLECDIKKQLVEFADENISFAEKRLVRWIQKDKIGKILLLGWFWSALSSFKRKLQRK